MKKVCVIGHYGFGEELLNGQTIKTKNVTEELERQLGNECVMKIDTHGGVKSFAKLPFQIILALKHCQNVIILPAENGLRIVVPMLVLFNGIFRRKLHYVVIGGWLPQFISGKRILLSLIKKINVIYVETKMMKSIMQQMELNNIQVMPNFKQLSILKENELVYVTSLPYKLCTFSRVMKEKGIEDAVHAVIYLNSKAGYVKYSLDIYGQIDKAQEIWFIKLKSEFPDYVKYRGTVPFGDSTKILKEYYALLFPTYYEGEGFAGTIIDAFAAGIPVIASDWKYNTEIIDIEKTGLITKCRDLNGLCEAIENLSNYYLSMKVNCIKEARQYIPKDAIRVLIQNLK